MKYVRVIMRNGPCASFSLIIKKFQEYVGPWERAPSQLHSDGSGGMNPGNIRAVAWMKTQFSYRLQTYLLCRGNSQLQAYSNSK